MDLYGRSMKALGEVVAQGNAKEDLGFSNPEINAIQNGVLTSIQSFDRWLLMLCES